MIRLFGTDGIRALAGEFPLNASTIAAIGQSIGEKLNGEILLGQDTRISSPWIFDLVWSKYSNSLKSLVESDRANEAISGTRARLDVPRRPILQNCYIIRNCLISFIFLLRLATSAKQIRCSAQLRVRPHRLKRKVVKKGNSQGHHRNRWVPRALSF